MTKKDKILLTFLAVVGADILITLFCPLESSFYLGAIVGLLGMLTLIEAIK